MLNEIEGTVLMSSSFPLVNFGLFRRVREKRSSSSDISRGRPRIFQSPKLRRVSGLIYHSGVMNEFIFTLPTLCELFGAVYASSMRLT